MFASRFFVSFLAVSGLAAYANPVAEKRAGVTDVLGIVGDLQGIVGGILPEITGLLGNNTATAGNIVPLVGDLVSALTGAASALGGLGSVTGEITTVLSSAVDAIPVLGPIFEGIGIDAIINELLVQLEIIVGGVITLVSEL
ncbi:hypothetical protein CPB84DRAFT_1793538 [Gymnopilus junonius]|uniref:Uncharacterized protein n=1 Tax=Gymnopilus junonius TaxID=109634 RepID=A0A9P5NCD8_GYMJU|nr:hypothetical protein CPB84DRAFT_1793538 [Gymnopilus junonius]